MMEWHDTFSVGCKLLDDQHKELVVHVDKLEKLIDQKIEGPMLYETFLFLVNYARNHFRDEEILMEKISFPLLDEQKKFHNDFIEQIDEMLLKLKDSKNFDSRQLVDFLVGWVKNHVLVDDMKIGEFIKTNNISCRC